MILQNKNILISGATGGIGSSVASILADHGCNIFLTSKDELKLSNLYNRIKTNSKNVSRIDYCKGDLSIKDDVERIIQDVKNKFGHVDVLINNAGVFLNAELSDITDDEFNSIINVNLRSAFMFSRAFISGMTKNRWGRIVNIGSSSSYTGFSRTTIYCASKHALLGLSRALHDEYKEYNVRTYCISPSSTKTAMGLYAYGQDYSTFIDPDDVAKYIAFCITFDSKAVTNEMLINRMEYR